MSYRAFDEIFAEAASHKGGEDALSELLPTPKSTAELEAIPDDRWLAGMARAIFQSGFSWKVVETKWPGFEVAFEGFDPHRVAMFSDEDLDRLVSDKSIIRNGQKIQAVIHNAGLVCDLVQEGGSAGAFFAAWPAANFTGLWSLLKTRGSRLSGSSGQFFLRQAGWDTPIMSRDVVAALIREGVVEKTPTSKKALAAVEQAFNQWHDESGFAFSAISRTLAASCG